MIKFLSLLKKGRLLFCCIALAYLTTPMVYAHQQTDDPVLEKSITVNLDNKPLKIALDQISAASSVVFIYSNSKDLLNLVTIHARNKPLKEVLDQLLRPFPLAYQVIDDRIIISNREKKIGYSPPKAKAVSITGKVTDELGSPLPGATVRIVENNIATTTDRDGIFTFNQVIQEGTLFVSFIGYQSIQVPFDNKSKFLVIALKENESSLNEVQIIGYGATTRRLNTGDVSSVKAAEIEKQAVANPLLALEGQIPGLLVTESSGVNGSGVTVQLRGQNSLKQGSDPLFIIDGVPYSPGNSPLNQLLTAAGDGSSTADGLSPFDLVNPSDIESITVLKDAGATAIYGSRGANGVILITTKKGKAGKTIVNANYYTGISTVTRTMPMLNTQQYLQMRREAFKNDSITPNASNAPDIFLWDTTRYTDFKKLLIGNTAHTNDAQVSLSGGSENTQFLLSGSYHYQTTVYPTEQGDGRASVHLNLNHNSTDKKFTITLSTIYASDVNNLPTTDLTSYINTAPNQKIYDASGNLNWQEGGVPYADFGLSTTNPLAFEYQTYVGKFQNLSSNLQLNYKIISGLSAKISVGYNIVNSNEESLYPSASLDPNQGQLPYSYFANETQSSWIIEPQLEYAKKVGPGKLDALIGNTWQDNSNNGTSINAYNYSSDLLLGSVAAAGGTQSINFNNDYRYTGLYGRINYNLYNKYLLDVSGRRDGSSRFGPDNRFSNFGALGAGWIFSEENFIKNNISFLSYGKLRGSYGLTGNDQIGNYRYLDTWSPSNNTYQGVGTLNPTSLYNPSFQWEKNRKSEIAVDLGFLKDRVLISADYYNNRSSNQLINYTLPSQTGFTSVLENLDAIIENTGWEFQLSSKNIVSSSFTWSSSFNLTAPQNKLVSFPGLANSSYANTYVIGQSVSTRRLYHFLGVDPTTGVYQFQDVDQNGIYNNADKVALKSTDPEFYGGFENSFRYKNLELSVFLEFRKQDGYNYLNTLAANLPGTLGVNQPVIVLSRWQNPGDITNIQKFTETTGAAFNAAYNYLGQSDAVISDASFIRCKNVSLSYNFSPLWLGRMHIASGRLFIQGQNLFTITDYVGADPENQNMYSLPPLKTVTLGIQLTL